MIFIGQPKPLFVLLKHNFYSKKLYGIRTWIVEVEGEHADHLTTTTARNYFTKSQNFYCRQRSTYLFVTRTS